MQTSILLKPYILKILVCYRFYLPRLEDIWTSMKWLKPTIFTRHITPCMIFGHFTGTDVRPLAEGVNTRWQDRPLSRHGSFLLWGSAWRKEKIDYGSNYKKPSHPMSGVQIRGKYRSKTLSKTTE